LRCSPYLASLIWLAGFGFPGYPVFPALLFTLASIYLLLPLYEGRFVAPGILTAGIATGCGALFRYDLGLAAATAQALVTLAFLVSRPVAVQDRRRTSLKFTALYTGGLAIPIVTVAAAYLLLGALGDFWFDIVGGAGYYAATRGLPFPSISITTVPGLYSTAVYLPIWVAATFYIFSIRRGAGGAEPEVTAHQRIGTNWAALQILVLAIVFFLKGCIRVSPIHMAPAILQFGNALAGSSPAIDSPIADGLMICHGDGLTRTGRAFRNRRITGLSETCGRDKPGQDKSEETRIRELR